MPYLNPQPEDLIVPLRNDPCMIFVRNVPSNKVGKDYVIGDLHGQVESLEEILEYVAFDKTCDRLFSCGDLVDRGHRSGEILYLAQEPWFFPVRGNHDDMLVQAAILGFDDRSAREWLYSDGTWALAYDHEELRKLSLLAASLPTIITVGDDPLSPDFHVVHAEILPTYEDEIVDEHYIFNLNEMDDAYVRDRLVWGRTLYRMSDERVQNIHPDGLSPIFCGHTIVSLPFKRGRQCFIDTGAFLPDGALTIVETSSMTWHSLFDENPISGHF